MVLELGDVLTMDSMRRAAPELLGTGGHCRRQVSWLHSSEIYEIAPLLSRGVVLLTTGLGLAGADAGARRHWVRDVAAREVAAVALEPGRSLPVVPPEIVDEAARSDLPLVVLHEVVPFVEICREGNERLIAADLTRLRQGERLLRDLHDAVQGGAGIAGLVAEVARVADRPAAVVTLAGQVVAAAGTTGTTGRAGARLGRVVERGSRAVVHVRGRPWGHLVLGERADADTDFLAARAAQILAIVVDRSAGPGPGSEELAAALLEDLLGGGDATADPPADLLVRAGLVGLTPGRDDVVLAVAATAPEPDRAARVLTTTLGAAPHTLARVRGLTLGLVVRRAGGDPAGELAASLDDPARRAGAFVAVAQPGPLARSGRGLRTALAAVRTARSGTGAVPARRAALAHVLASMGPAELAALATDSLAPLEDWDRRHGTDLVGTLGVYLRSGSRATRTADALHLRRQSLHRRLQRIEELLGHPLDVPEELDHLLLATAAAELAQGRY